MRESRSTAHFHEHKNQKLKKLNMMFIVSLALFIDILYPNFIENIQMTCWSVVTFLNFGIGLHSTQWSRCFKVGLLESQCQDR